MTPHFSLIAILLVAVIPATSRAAAISYLVTGTVQSMNDSIGLGVNIGAPIALTLTISDPVSTSPGYRGLPYPDSMTYLMPPAPPRLLTGAVGATVAISEHSSHSVGVRREAPSVGGADNHQMLVFGTGIWGSFGTSSSGPIYLTLTDAEKNALIGTSLPTIGNLSLFESAVLTFEAPITSKFATIEFTPTFAVVPETAVMALAVPALLLFGFRRRR